MTPATLASLIAPNIIYRRDAGAILADSMKSNNALEVMITHHQQLFLDIPKQPSLPSVNSEVKTVEESTETHEVRETPSTDLPEAAEVTESEHPPPESEHPIPEQPEQDVEPQEGGYGGKEVSRDGITEH
jgi:hypothetical protein